MKIALLGYGKMGKEIEKIALSRNHQIVLIIDINNQNDLTIENIKKADVAIDFSIPSSAFNNIMMCFDAGIPIVCGTTGWLEKIETVKEKCITENKAFFYASNYSLGANVFFRLNKYLAKMMSKLSDYQAEIEEVHHIHKLDAPSGTAITLAEGIIENIPSKTGWILNQQSDEKNIGIKAIREGEVPGIHRIKYNSKVDFINIEHSAYSRQGLALGAVLAAEFMKGKTGFRTMDDLLDIG
jgi:4-hydroxy-tetrahydrodipicolinate reductase